LALLGPRRFWVKAILGVPTVKLLELELDVGCSCETEMERWQVIAGIEAKGGDYIGD